MNPSIHYTPTDSGYAINGSSELFNRTLYGSHKNDSNRAKFFTFAGDAPQFMGALTDWAKNSYSFYAKCGTLISGLALTPGQRVGFGYSPYFDVSSRWFHDSADICAEFKAGWMEYELSQMSPWFPDVKVNIEAYPLMPDDGFLVHYKITTDQRVIFAAGFGGLTDYIGRFEYKEEQKRNFSASDCVGNTVEFGKNHALVKHSDGREVYIGTSFDAAFEPGSASELETPYPSTFLGSTPQNNDDTAVKISAVIDAGQTLDGYIVVLCNSGKGELESWLTHKDPAKYIKEQIYHKHACINVKTPQNPFDITVAPTVIALDQSWHHNSFHHGAFGYHAPFLGWRNWYAPTVLGWSDRVRSTMSAHLEQIVKKADGEERVWYDESITPGKYGSQYNKITGSTGYLPNFLGGGEPEYNMQECAFDMMLYYIEWTGDIEFAKKYYDDLCQLLDREERVFDPDSDGLYQNFLNTWISDGHSYNGAGCAQASAYNYRANLVMAKIAKLLGKPSELFESRAQKIRNQVQSKLWIANKGVIAESLDTVGNRLIHPAPELSTVYLAIDCGISDEFQSYTMLKYTENHIKSIETSGTGGRLSYSSAWLPKKYSTCGLFPAENAHLALAYYKLGLKNEGKKLLDGIADCYFTGRNPGMAAHVQSSKGTADLADLDFTDVSGTYLRLVVEGLFGIRFDSLENTVTIAPNFPDEWEGASLSLEDISLHYTKSGNQTVYDVYCDREEIKVFKIPMLGTDIEAVFVNGEISSYTTKAAPNGCFVIVETAITGNVRLCVMHGHREPPTVEFAKKVLCGSEILFEITDGDIADYMDISEVLCDVQIAGNKIYAGVKDIPGYHTLFVRVKSGEYDAWLAADYEIEEKKIICKSITDAPFEPIDISAYFNSSVTSLHEDRYMSPRPDGYSIGVHTNGRYAWEWNHGGHNKLVVNDDSLRLSGGVVHTKSGIPFVTPECGNNLACVSVWDNFPDEITIPMETKAHEAAVMFVSATNCMQTHVENAHIAAIYADGTEEEVKLVYPVNIDDWLVPALQSQNETYYFNDYNHATVQKVRLNPQKELAGIRIKAVANEVIVGVIGVSIR